LLPSILLFARVLPLDDLVETADLDLDVFGGGGDLAVSEDLLNVGDVGVFLENAGHAGVAQRVEMEAGDANSSAASSECHCFPVRLRYRMRQHFRLDS